MGVKLGQKWAVKDGNLLASNQVGSRFFNKEFDFSRASNGTYVDRDGLLKTAELYNLLEYSQDFSQGYWLKTDVSLTDSQIGYNATNNATLLTNTSAGGYLRTTYTFDGSVVTTSIYAKKGDYDFLMLFSGGNYCFFNLSNGDIGTEFGATLISKSIESIGNDWYRCSLTHNFNGVSTIRFYPIIADNDQSGTSGSIYIQDAQLVEGTEPLAYQYTNGLQGLPRISFEDGVGHLLLEPQRSNLLLQSNSFDTTWTTINASVTSGQSGVYGTNDAWLLQNNTNSGFVNQNISTTGVSVFSVYAKAGNVNFIRVRADYSSIATTYFDLANGTIGTESSVIKSEITSVGNGWYRCSIVFDGTTTKVRLYPAISDGDTSGLDNSIYIQHAQLESGSYPTSIIETTTTSVTRLADVCNNSGSAQDFNSEEGVLYAEIAALVDDGTNRRFTLNDGTTTNQVVIGYHSVLNEFRCFVVTASGLSCDLRPSVTSILDYHKIAFKYKENDFSIWVDGVEAATDSSGVVPIGLNQIDFTEGNGANPFYGKVRNLQAFTEALSDAELQQLTT